MNVAHGVRGAAVSGATWAATEVTSGDHSIEAAVITAAGGVLAVVVGPLLTDRFRRRRRVNHAAEAEKEQAALADWLRSQLDHQLAANEAKDAEIIELRKANDRLRRRRP